MPANASQNETPLSTWALDREIVDVRHAFHQASIDELLDQRLAHSVDVHDAARREVQDRFFQAGRAIRVDAPAGRLAFLPHHISAANRTMLGHAERPPVRAFLEHANHFRNHVSRALDHYLVADLEAHGGTVVSTREAQHIAGGTVFVSGEIPRRTPFETGLPGQHRRTADGKGWEPDELLVDERFVAVNVRGKGLVVLTACSHAGVINVLAHARDCFPGEKLHCVLGGLHLSGTNERVIPQTVEALKGFDLDVVAAGHCTGWRAMAALANAFGDKKLTWTIVANGFTNTIEEFDLRPGGTWRLVMHGPDWTDYHNVSGFVEVVPAERIVYDHLEPIHRFREPRKESPRFVHCRGLHSRAYRDRDAQCRE